MTDWVVLGTQVFDVVFFVGPSLNDNVITMYYLVRHYNMLTLLQYRMAR
jgi:hypothetical protein